MNKTLKVGIVKETKNPPDRRVAVTPKGAKEIMENYDNVELVVQASNIRAFSDDEYRKAGATVVDDVSDCDILIGVKEVEIDELKANKKYLFFSHTAKQQEYNRLLLQALLEKNITLIDHEYLTDDKGVRLAAFGHWAGVVGAYNGIRAFGKRTASFELPRAIDSKDTKTIYEELKKIALPPVKILLSGGGRVAGGAEQTLQALGLKKVNIEDFLTENFEEAVYSQLAPCHYVEHAKGEPYNNTHFFAHPKDYKSTFFKYTKVTDIYIACHFWDDNSPKFITNEEIQNPEFKIAVIADVSCDIADPIASTIRPSAIDDPFYGFDKKTLKETAPFAPNAITVMAVDNLPGEVPRDASKDFGRKLLDNVFPALFGKGQPEIIERASITKAGKLGRYFKYLQHFAEGK